MEGGWKTFPRMGRVSPKENTSNLEDNKSQILKKTTLVATRISIN